MTANNPVLDAYPKVSVIVPCFGQSTLLRRCVLSIETQEYAPDKIEIVLVDNNPTPTITRDLVGNDPRLLIVHESLPGSYAARNRGLQSSSGTIVAFTDADCTTDPEWLSNAIKELKEFHFKAAIGGKIRFTFHNADIPTLWEILDSIIHLRQEDYVKRLNFAATANLVVPRNYFAIVGVFNPEFLSGGDMDWGQRLHSRGIPIIYCPKAVVFHPARASATELILKHRRGVGAELSRGKIQGAFRIKILLTQARLFVSRVPMVLNEAQIRGYNSRTRFELLLRLGFLYTIRLMEAIRLILGGYPVR